MRSATCPGRSCPASWRPTTGGFRLSFKGRKRAMPRRSEEAGRKDGKARNVKGQGVREPPPPTGRGGRSCSPSASAACPASHLRPALRGCRKSLAPGDGRPPGLRRAGRRGRPAARLPQGRKGARRDPYPDRQQSSTADLLKGWNPALQRRGDETAGPLSRVFPEPRIAGPVPLLTEQAGWTSARSLRETPMALT